MEGKNGFRLNACIRKLKGGTIRPLLGTLLVLGLLLGTLTGCGGGKSSEEPAASTMGRYVEQEVASFADADQVMGLHLNGEGNLVFYTPSGTEAALMRCVLSPDGGVLDQTPVPWVEGVSYILDISEAEDGTVYFAASNETLQETVYRLKDGTTEALSLPELSQDSSAGGRHIWGIRSLPGGDFLLLFGGDGVSHYQGASAALLKEYPVAGYNWSVDVCNGKLLAPGLGQGEILVYDLGSGEQEQVFVFDDLSASACQGMDAEGIYLADTMGIYRMDQGSTQWDKLVEGDLTSLSLYSMTIGDVISDGADGFFVAFIGEGGLRLARYVYDASVPAEPDTTLTVFSLKDNGTVRQAIGAFQQRNPNVRVQFQVMTENASSAGTEDIIRTLNTELLNGNGPDILLLDGLPVESYMEKGVLADLTDQVNALADDGLLKNIANAYEYGGRYYGIPSRFTIPVMMGEEGVLDSIRSLEDLAVYAEAEWDGETPFLTASSRIFEDDGMLMDYYDACSIDFVSADGINEASMASYLSAMLRIQRAQEAVLSETGGIIDGDVELFELMGVTTMTLGAAEELFYIQEIPGTNSVNIIPASRNGESVSALRPLFGGSRYAARGAVGITSAGKQQDLARQFVELLLSQSVQDVYLYDGFPVNSHSLDRLVEDVTGFRGMCDKLDTPILVDQVVKEAVQSQLRGLLDGTSMPEDAASAVMEKAKLYLME